ncbi:MAG: hypothetical protein DWQ01_05795 [Planctomycetota bacterium]|nr:MAG: hypothetical protein DWQ01_05795 [Planctomycetota bacterium]
MAKRLVASLLVVGLLAPSLLAQGEPLAKRLPGQTLLYLEIPDVQGMVESAQSSSLARMYKEDSMQAFLGQFLTVLEEGWGEIRQMAEAQGVPARLLSWDAFGALEVGAGMKPPGPDSQRHEPDFYVGASIKLNQGLAPELYQFLSGMLVSQGEAQLVEKEDGSTVLHIGIAPGESASLWQEGDRLYGWMSTGDFGTTSLAGQTSFQGARTRALSEGRGLFLYFDIGSMMETVSELAQMGDPQGAALMTTMFSSMGIDSLGALSLGSGWLKDGSSSSIFSLDFKDGKPGGMWASMTDYKVDMGMLDYIPEAANSFSLSFMDMAISWDVAKGFLEELTAMDVGGATLGDMWAQEEPMSHAWLVGEKSSLLDRGLKGFGTRMFTFAEAAGGFGGAAGGGTFIEVRDVEGVRSMLHEFMPTASEVLKNFPEAPVKLEVKTLSIAETNADGQRVVREGPEYYLMSVNARALPNELKQASMALSMIQPTFGVTDDGWLVLGMSQSTVRTALKTGVKKPEKNIRSNPDVQAFLGRLPSSPMQVSWNDFRGGLEDAYTQMQVFLPMFAASPEMAELPVDLNSLPEAEVFVGNMQPTEMFTSMENGSIVTRTRGSVDLADLLLICASGACVAPVFMATSVSHEAHAYEEDQAAVAEVPAPEVVDSGASVQDELNRLKSGLVVFELEHNRYPSSLSELVKPTEDYPFGFLPDPERGLANDPWGNPFRYKALADGYLLYSMGPNGVDESGAGDDIQS